MAKLHLIAARRFGGEATRGCLGTVPRRCGIDTIRLAAAGRIARCVTAHGGTEENVQKSDRGLTDRPLLGHATRALPAGRSQWP